MFVSDIQSSDVLLNVIMFTEWLDLNSEHLSQPKGNNINLYDGLGIYGIFRVFIPNMDSLITVKNCMFS